MRLILSLVLGATMSMVAAQVAHAELNDELVYLYPDANDRYLPAIDSGSGAAILANVDSITPPAVSPDGSHIAFSGALGNGSLGRYGIFIVASDGSGLRQLTGGSFGEFDPAWSPDGQSVVVSQNRFGRLESSLCCRLAVFDVDSGSATTLTGMVGATRPEYAPSGNFIVYDTPSGVWRVSPNGGSTQQLTAAGGFDATVSPSGDRVAYLVGVGSGMQIRTVSASGGGATVVYSSSRSIEAPIWAGDRIYFLEYSGLGYDGRSSVSMRSVSAAGGGARAERFFSTHIVGLDASLYEPPAHTVGDIDGDGIDDIAESGPVNRTALLSTGSAFDPETWGSLLPQTGWARHEAGDFDGDGQSDVASYRTSNGTWHVATAGSSSYSVSVWADYSTGSGWSAQLVGDFSGDDRDDIANFHPANGTWWVSRSTGSGFATSLWADFSTPSGWGPQLVGDFDGDGRDDIANFHDSNGTWWVSRSTGSGFATSLWADFSTPSGWGPQLVGDFDGDGRDDIANFHDSNGTWWVSRSTGSGFVTSLWADFSTAKGWSAQVVGDFDGDGRDDIANFHSSNGTWWVSRSTGAGFTTSLWADFGTRTGWDHHVGDFTGDGRDDIANYHRPGGTWWVSESNGSGFTTPRWLP